MKVGTWCVRRAAAVVATLSLAACSSGFSASEPELGEIPVIHDPAEIVLPLDAYRLALEDYVTVQRAAFILTRECVQRFGVEYTLSESALLSNLPPLNTLNERRYGLFDPGSAQIRGYNVPDDLLVPHDGAPQWNPSATEELLVRGGYTGSPPTDTDGNPLPDDGCLGEANRVLDEGAPTEPPNVNLGNELSSEAYGRAESDSRVQTAITEWSSCMSDRGYSYESIWDPNDHNWPEPPNDSEIAVAMADVGCKEQTNLVGIWVAVESAYQRQILEDGANAEALAEVAAYLTVQKQNAARVVEGEDQAP